MENILNKIENELNSLSTKEREEILKRLREEVDVIDELIVPLLSKRTLYSVMIGRVKRAMNLPTYSPEREKEISKKINSYRTEPLSKEALLRIYERIIDESRAIQKEEANKGNIFNISAAKMKVGFKRLFPKRKDFHLTKKDFLIILFFFIAFLALFYYTFFTSNYYKGNPPIRFEINRGETLSRVTDRLYHMGIIPSKTNMMIAAIIYGADKRIRAARYNIPNGLSYLELLDLFLYGEADFLRKITIYDGATLWWIASKLKNDLVIDSVQVMSLMRNINFIDSLGYSTSSLEGYLLPGTYYIYERSSPKEALKIIAQGFQKFFADSLKQKAKTHGYSVNDILIVASIVEGETNKLEEMPIIAGVYYNRLKIGMKLQADPTVQYLHREEWRRLNYQDLRVDNPYNTYRYFGLPPGPINNPGKEAIMAAFYPANHKYLYFVADGNGGHKFSETYSQHLRLVKEYRKWLKTQSIN